MPDGFAGKRVMSAAIDYFCGLPARPGKPDHKSHQNDGKQQTDRDDDGQTVLKMNLVLDDEVILGKEEHHALSPNDNTDGALNWLRVDWAKAVETMRTTHGTCVRWNRIELPSSHSDSAHGEWTQPGIHDAFALAQLCFPYAGTQARVVFQPRQAPRAHG